MWFIVLIPILLGVIIQAIPHKPDYVWTAKEYKAHQPKETQ